MSYGATRSATSLEVCASGQTTVACATQERYRREELLPHGPVNGVGSIKTERAKGPATGRRERGEHEGHEEEREEGHDEEHDEEHGEGHEEGEGAG